MYFVPKRPPRVSPPPTAKKPAARRSPSRPGSGGAAAKGGAAGASAGAAKASGGVAPPSGSLSPSREGSAGGAPPPAIVIIGAPGASSGGESTSPLERLGDTLGGAAKAVGDGLAAVGNGLAVARDVVKEVTDAAGVVREVVSEGAALAKKLTGQKLWKNLDRTTILDGAKQRVGPTPKGAVKHTVWTDASGRPVHYHPVSMNTSIDPAVGPQVAPFPSAASGASMIQQANRGLCGPTSVLHALAEFDGPAYLKLVEELFEDGRVNGKMVTPNLLDGVPNPDPSVHPAGFMPDVDWMTLCSLRNTMHQALGFTYSGEPAGDPRTLSLPEEVAEWMRLLLGCVETKFVTTLSPGSRGLLAKVPLLLTSGAISRLLSGDGTAKDAGELLSASVDGAAAAARATSAETLRTMSDLLRTHAPAKDVVVSLLVSGKAFVRSPDLISGAPRTFATFASEKRIPDHYVRLVEPLEFDGDHVKRARVHSWGNDHDCFFTDKPGERIEDYCFGFVIGSKKSGLLSALDGQELDELGIRF